MEQARNAANELIVAVEGDVQDLILYTENVIEAAELQAILNRIRSFTDLVEHIVGAWDGVLAGTPPSPVGSASSRQSG